MVKEVKLDKMDELIEALGGGGGGGSDVPTPTVQDDGKILSVAGGEYILAETYGGFVPNASSSDDGKVLTAIYDDKSGNCNARWTTPEGGLPSIGSSDNGKVLKAYYDSRTETSGVEWTTVPIIKSENITKDDITVDDKSGEAIMYIPENSVILTIHFTGSSNAIYPVEYLYYSNSGTIRISSDEYQKITDDPTGQYIVYYIN